MLFHLPITKDWIRQFVLAQVLIGHTSFRGVTEILDAAFDYRGISARPIHNIVQDAITSARPINESQDLSAVRVGAHDEIFQASKPVLVGMDVESTYCYLLADEAHRDGDTWGVHLLDLTDRGLRPDRTIADGGSGLRAGQAEAWPGVPCNGDVFHAEREIGMLANYLANRASRCTTAREKLERKMERSKKKGQGQTLSKRLAITRKAEAVAVALANDGRFDELAARLDVPLRFVQAVCELQGLDQNLPAYWQREGRLRKKLCADLQKKIHAVQLGVREILAATPRASSIVENLNSRLRNYFFLRRQIGNGSLDLLRFFLNHRRYIRSDRPERIGKSPTELLNGEPHPHWLELLGFERFHQN